MNTPQSCADVETVGLSWYYTWWHTSECASAGAEFVPMLWGDWCTQSSDCAEIPNELNARGARMVLGFNEPDSTDQANMTVERALQLWAYLDATGMRLASPAVQNTERGRAWLAAFMAGATARGLRVDVVTVHWYGDCAGTGDLLSTMRQYAQYGRPLWLTEFSCWKRNADVNRAFVEGTLAELANSNDIERIAWFTNRSYVGGYEGGALVAADGEPTEVGRAYSSFPACRSAARSLVSC